MPSRPLYRYPPPVPLADRPILALQEVTTLLQKRTSGKRIAIFKANCRLRELCEIEPAISISRGRISISGLHRLLRRLAVLSDRPVRRGYMAKLKDLDRISLLLWLCGFEEKLVRKPVRYAVTIDAEIKRIRSIRDPILKAMRAAELISRYTDARALADALRDGFPLPPSGAMRMVKELDHILGIDTI